MAWRLQEGGRPALANCMHGARSLDTIGVLAGLSADERAQLAGRCTWRNVPRGLELFSAETDSTDVYLVAKGRIRVTIYSPGGREVAFREVSAGGTFGELSAIDGRGRSAGVLALEDSLIAAMTREQFWRLIETNTAFAADVLTRLAALVRDLTARVIDTTVLTVPMRVRADVLRRARDVAPDAASATIKPFPTHAELASRIGATREAVTRELGRMTREGLIARNGNSLQVFDIEALSDSLDDGG